MREKLPVRRRSITGKIFHERSGPDGATIKDEYLLTFGFDQEGSIREVFCADPRVGSDIHALLTDGCIMISIYLQTGGAPEQLVTTLGENRNEGEERGRPSSVLGAIARALVEVQTDVGFEPAPPPQIYKPKGQNQ